ncbi:MAG: glycosyltransferase family 39 protein, partial [Patescibacteria group bacterium]|nr:glycosyltransferase family 39 protein [Patescibacteria group bacterium]
MKKEKFLIFILIIAVFFRLYKLSSIPAGFFCDEASIGYNAYSILNSGKDEYGVPFPIFFQSLGDYKSPLAIYLTIPFIKFFGLNEFSTRLTSVLAGLTMVAVMYFVGKELSMGDSKLSGLLVAFVTATMPWLIHYSRVGFEYTLYCVFFVSSVYLFLKAQHYKKYIIPAFVLAAITMYTYQSAKLLIPVLIIGVIVIYR